MKQLIFDTGVFSRRFTDERPFPEKWVPYWRGASEGTKTLILFEGLVAEMFYKLAEKRGFNFGRQKVAFVKSLRGVRVQPVTDEDAIRAGEIHIRTRRHRISLMDAWVLAIASRTSARVVTTDSGLQQASKMLGVEVDHLPVSA